MVKKTSKRVMITCPDSMLVKIDSKASELGINRSAFIVMCVSSYIKNDDTIKSLPNMLLSIQELNSTAKQLEKSSVKLE